MIQPDVTQPDFAQGGGQLLSAAPITGTVNSPTIRVPELSHPVFTADIADLDWDAPGTDVTIRVYQTIDSVRTLVSEGTVTTGPTTIKGGAPTRGKKPRSCLRMAPCDADVEIVLSSQATVGVTVEI